MYRHNSPVQTYLNLVQRYIRTFNGRYILQSMFRYLGVEKDICLGEAEVRNEFVFILKHQPLSMRAKSMHGFQLPSAVPPCLSLGQRMSGDVHHFQTRGLCFSSLASNNNKLFLFLQKMSCERNCILLLEGSENHSSQWVAWLREDSNSKTDIGAASDCFAGILIKHLNKDL